MTGFSGALVPEGASFDPGIAAAMAAAIERLGPDRQDRWDGGRICMAHALLATTFEEESDSQPFSLDGEARIVADARIDGRAVLIAKLREAGRDVAGSVTDSALILHAWHVWGEACPEHLIGDFAFAIWDPRTRTLFAARDQFGSVPFYHARVGDAFLFGNAVPALLAHPGLDRALNPVAIGDYLMFGHGLDRRQGFYRNIARLAPGHCLTLRDGELRERRYWSPPDPEFAEANSLPDDEIVERFGAVLQEAVTDRLRTARVATTLSGGMDSTMIAGIAMRARRDNTRLDAYSFGGDWLLPDTERHWAWRCAHHLGLPFHSISVERCYTDPPGGHFRIPPEPRMELRTSSYHLVAEALGREGIRVLLLGMGGDTLVAGGHHHWSGLAADRKFGRLIREAAGFWRYHRRRPPLRSALLRRGRLASKPLIAPLDPEFAREHRLEERWRDNMTGFAGDPRVAMTDRPFWTEMFVASHPESTGMPIRTRQPFFDVRLLEAAMRLPPTPWRFDKAILRRLGAGMLPDDILRRPKTLFGLNSGWEAARRGLEPWLADLPFAVELDGYVDRMRLASIVRDIQALPSAHYSASVTLPASLAAWLRAHQFGGR